MLSNVNCITQLKVEDIGIVMKLEHVNIYLS